MGLLSVFIAIALGILLADTTPTIPSYVYIVISFLILLSFIYVRNKFVWITLAFITTLILITVRVKPHSVACVQEAISYTQGQKVNISGWIIKPVMHYPDRHKIIIKIDKINNMDIAHGCLVQLFAFDKSDYLNNLTLGDYINAYIKLREPKNLKNPGSFDYKTFLLRNGIGLVSYTNKTEDISFKSGIVKKGFFREVDKIRIKTRQIITRSVNDKIAYSIALALVIGDQGYISHDVRKMFASTGIIHILVVAGLHLAIITHLFYLLIKLLLSRSKYLCLHTNIPKFSLALSLIPMIMYILITGANPPVVRSGIMIAVYCMLFFLNRTQARWTGIFVAGILILVINPMDLYSISFQLSFVAVCSIIAFIPAITAIVTNIKSLFTVNPPRFITTIAHIFFVSLFVTIGLGAIIAFYFNTLPLLGIALNVIVIPFFCYLVVPLSLLATVLGIIHPFISHVGFTIITYLITFIVKLVSLVSTFPLASIRVPTPTLYEILVYYSILITLINAKKLKTKTTVTLLSIFMLIQLADIGYYIYKNHFNKELRITFIDVGQGDSALIELPYGKTILLDAGGGGYHSYDIGEAVVARYIWNLKRNKINYVIASHPQIDHIGGLGFIIKNMDVKEVYQSDCEPQTNTYKDFILAVQKAKPKLYKIVDNVKTFELNGVKVELIPVPHSTCDPHSEKDINNYAIITKITYKNVSVIFTGDIEKKAEKILFDTYNTNLKADILKVAHHGSRSSSSEAFLEAVKPRIAVISVGESNPFHMPSKTVLKRLFERGISTYRTDRHGAIKITTDGKDIKIKTYGS